MKEEHHAFKTHAHSGTAADTAVQLSAVLFDGAGEILRITHEVFANDAFGPGDTRWPATCGLCSPRYAPRRRLRL